MSGRIGETMSWRETCDVPTVMTSVASEAVCSFAGAVLVESRAKRSCAVDQNLRTSRDAVTSAERCVGDVTSAGVRGMCDECCLWAVRLAAGALCDVASFGSCRSSASFADVITSSTKRTLCVRTCVFSGAPAGGGRLSDVRALRDNVTSLAACDLDACDVITLELTFASPASLGISTWIEGIFKQSVLLLTRVPK